MKYFFASAGVVTAVNGGGGVCKEEVEADEVMRTGEAGEGWWVG